MADKKTKSLFYLAQYVPIASMIGVSHLLPFDARCTVFSRVAGWAVRWLPPFRMRVDEGLQRVYPDLSRRERSRIAGQVGRNVGRSLTEILHLTEFHTQHHKFETNGPGLGAVKEASAAGKGAIIVSGHFGQWEAIRAVVKMNGLESGAVYRPHKNRHYERRLLAGIKAGGQPILATGRAGTKALVRHIRSGGIVSILMDEKQAEGTGLPFLGHDALTSLSAAQLALKYDVPLVPAYGIRIGDGNAFHVEFEAPIPHTDPVTMTRAFNDSLSARIMANPVPRHLKSVKTRDVFPLGLLRVVDPIAHTDCRAAIAHLGAGSTRHWKNLASNRPKSTGAYDRAQTRCARDLGSRGLFG